MKKLNKKISLAIIFILVMSIVLFTASNVKAMVGTHTISFDTNGGTPSTIETQTFNDGDELPTVTKEGFDFGGWYYIDETAPEDAPWRNCPVEGTQVKSYLPEEVTLIARWITTVDTININIDLPVGTEVSECSLQESAITVPSGANYVAFPDGAGVRKSYDDDSAFEGIVEEGQDYYIELGVFPVEAIFDQNVAITINGKADSYQIYPYYAGEGTVLNDWAIEGFWMVAKITAGATTTDDENLATETDYTVLEGEGQTITNDEELSFRFSIDYDKFATSGAVYTDDELVDPDNYDSESGSTIIKFKDEYVKTLSVGTHTVKVTVDDGEVSTEFTIAKKSSNPKTGDNIVMYIAFFTVAILGSVVVIKKIK